MIDLTHQQPIFIPSPFSSKLNTNRINLLTLKPTLTHKQQLQLSFVYNHIYQYYHSLNFQHIYSDDYQFIQQVSDQQIKLNKLCALTRRSNYLNKRTVSNIIQQKLSKSQSQDKLKMMVHINFPNLQILKIPNLKLTTIDNLSFTNAPHLKCLQMYHNLISSIKPLQKSYFKKLQTLTVYDNKISSMKQLSRGQYPRLNRYQLDKYYEDVIFLKITQKYKKLIEDYTFLFKMQNHKLKKIHLMSKQRVRTFNRKNILKKLNRFASLKLDSYKQVHWISDDDQQITEQN